MFFVRLWKFLSVILRVAGFILPVVLIVPGVALSVHAGYAGQSRYFTFEHLSVGDGLSNGEVKCVVEDRLGYIWIGTADGLNRYDGYGFKTYRHSRADSNSIGDSHVTALAVDGSGALWVGTREGGLSRFNAADETFTRFQSRPGDSTSLGEGGVNDVYIDRTGTLWVTTGRGGLNRFDPERGTFRRYQADSANPRAPRTNDLGAMYDDGEGTLWIGSWSAGLHAFNFRDESFERYGRYPHDTSVIMGIGGVLSIAPDRSGKLWMGTRRQLNLFDRATKRFEPVLPDRRNPGRISKDVNAVRVDRFNTLWIGTYFDGLILVDLDEGIGERFVHYRYGKDRREDGWIPSSRVDAIYEDSRGNMWVGTGDGLLKASRNRRRFEHLRHVPADPSSLPEDRIRSVFAGGGDSAWLATEGGGLVLYDRRTGTIAQRQSNASDPSTIGGDVVNEIARGPDGSLWLALDGQGLDRYSPETGWFTRYKNSGGAHPDLYSNWINAVAVTGDGRVWLGTVAGLLSFDPAREAFDRIKGAGEPSVTAIVPARDGHLWFGTNGNGLFRYAPSNGEIEQFTRTPGDDRGLSNNRIRVIHEGRGGALWIGTFGGGLNRFDPRTREFRSFGAGDGLAGDVVEGIAEDGRGMLWVSTNNGLSRFDSATGKFRSYRAADGLPATRFQGQGACLASGELVFGTFSEGVVLFHPDDLAENAAVPAVLITAVRKYGSETNLLDGARGALTFSHSENAFSVEFIALDCTAPGRNRYAYRLDGVSPGWVQCGTRRSVEFSNVAPGDYTLRVRGSNNDGVWGEASVPLEITILPPFWDTWWFLTLAAGALAALAGLIYRLRVSRLLAVERLRLKLAGDLHDDLGSNLSGIALMADLVRNGTAGERERERLLHISTSARAMADSLKDLVWMIGPQHDTFDDLNLRLKDTAAVLLSSIPYTFSGGEELASRPMSMDARRHLFLMFKEILHNIVKHSAATSVDISIRRVDGCVVLRIADNGRGFAPGGTKGGNGLSNLRKRAAALGGTIDVESAAGKGTVATLRVKIP